MIPNKFVILWNSQPIELQGNYPVEPYPAKSKNPSRIQYWDTHAEALHYLTRLQSKYPNEYIGMEIKEIQFRIMDK